MTNEIDNGQFKIYSFNGTAVDHAGSCIIFYRVFSPVLLLQKEEIYLNLVLDFVPETVYRVARHYSKAKQTIPILYIKVSHLTLNTHSHFQVVLVRYGGFFMWYCSLLV